ncbi:MAG: class I SAM-dependent methyltransferase [Labilithrix sp.]|nr:class I SAM-dependent methyltransferase [Labilithrix sp.]
MRAGQRRRGPLRAIRVRLTRASLCQADSSRKPDVSTSQKDHAVQVHTTQAAEFEARYRALHEDPYRSTFTYGRKKIETLLDGLTATLARGTRALDVGCGTGFNVQRLASRGFDVVGIEPSPAMRDRARTLNPGLQVDDGDIENLAFPDASFDFVLSIEVIRYLADPQRGLSEIARVLRPGGLAVVTAAPLLSLNGYALINALTSRLQIPTFTKVKHSFMTERGARHAMSEAGFSRVDVHGVFLGPWQGLGRVSSSALAATLRLLEPLDDMLSDRPGLRNLTNHLVLVGTR